MLATQLLATTVLLAVNALGPGLFLTRRLRLGGVERFVSAIGLSALVVYAFAAGIYLSGVPWSAAWGVSALSAVLCFVCMPDLRRLLRRPAVRGGVVGFGILFAWMLVLTCILRTYSGGFWINDWLEHYSRSRFFLDRMDLHHVFVGNYILPARPPMMNVLAAFFMAQTGVDFAVYQLVFNTLNLSAYFASAALLPVLAPRGRRALVFLTVLFLSSPVVAQQATFTWTKLYAAFYAVAGIAVYARTLSPARRSDAYRIGLAFTLLAAGCLVHYSAAPFALFVGLHYAYRMVRRRPIRWREALAAGVGPVLVLGPWFAWSLAIYGRSGALASNTSITDAAKYSTVINLQKIGMNILMTLVPFTLWQHDLVQPGQSTAGTIRDITFTAYQQNAFLSLGTAGVITLCWFLARAVRHRTVFPLSPLAGFMVALVVVCVPLAVGTVGQYLVWGLAHVVLQPVALIGFAAAAAAVSRRPPRLLVGAVMLACFFDFLIGIALHFHLQNMVFSPPATPATDIWTMPMQVGTNAYACFLSKVRFGFEFMGDYTARQAGLLQLLLFVIEIAAIVVAWRSLTRRGTPRPAPTNPAPVQVATVTP